MTAVEDLAEVASRALAAEAEVRSVRWQSRTAVEKAAIGARDVLDKDRAALNQPTYSGLSPSPHMARQLELITRLQPPLPADASIGAAAQAEADAVAAVTTARIALEAAHLAVLEARVAALDAGDSDDVAAAIRGYVPLAAGNPAVRHMQDLGSRIREEFRHVFNGKPRSIAFRLGLSLGLGFAYLAFIRLFQWDSKEDRLPYLALYALSGVIGSVVCTNALSFDAGRVRAALSGGTRLWHVLVAKNIVMLILVGAAGFVLSVVLSWRAGNSTELLKACGQVLTMILLWLGVANVMSVSLPLRAEPILERRYDGTWKPFMLSFAISYGVGLVVNLMLYWRVWAKTTLLEQMGGPWIPVLMLVASAAATWLLLTVLAVLLAEQPRFRRALQREMIVYRDAAETVKA
ncbi:MULTISPECIES: ABC transporter permease [Rhodococcus]|uniref:Uncharacterized protein n=1 Tax=Nocardia globerula TaxID=1818 RepID=A0A652YNW9_NOCGL|nr:MULTISPECIES: ABC transporter permease [Rhodococcus]KJF25013.1 hypothetical protein SZ00_01939 [Rhodococcus sp. AD45]PVX68394.1 hypothetical protein C8E04_5781 [Rhodococcus globerulus]